MTITIIGGGIGGLATAVALHRIGIDAHVYERSEQLRETGAGLSLWRNALLALDAIGLGDACRAHSLPYPGAALRRWDGRVLVSPAEKELKALIGEVGLVMHRAALLRLLSDAAGSDRIHLGKTCVAVDANGDKVTARFSDGSAATADALIGADGLHSVVRRAVLGDDPPTYSGYTAWRGVTSFDHSRLAAGESWGSGQRFGQVQMANSEVYWFATKNAPAGETSSSEKETVLNLFRQWHAPIPDLVAATPTAAVLRNDIYDRPPARTWTRGRITLLGDAAHPMTPNLGQGGCQALEDAVVLARALTASSNVADAWHMYERARMTRTAFVTTASRRVGALGQWSNPAAIALRNRVIALFGGLQVRQIVSLVSYDAGTVRVK